MAIKNIRLSKSIVGPEEVRAVSRILLEDGYLGMGNEVRLFEEEIARFLGIPSTNVICVNSGMAALHLAVESLVKPGQEVLVQSLTFVASFQAISAAGAIPVPCEVNPNDISIDLADAKKKITPLTKAIMPVHYAGNPGNLQSIYEFAAKHGLRVIEDAAHAFGGTYKKKKIGSFGDVVCFSFDGIKNITSAEGGAVITGDDSLGRSIQDERLLGVEHDTEKRYLGKRSWEFNVIRQGYRYHMSNIFAAIGRTQLKRLESEFAPRRRALVNRYRKCLGSCSGVSLFDWNDEVVPHIFAIRVLNGKRDALRAYLEKCGIGVGIHYKPNHLLTYYGGGGVSLPVTEALFQEILSLPLHPEVSDADIDYICDCTRQFIGGAYPEPDQPFELV